MGTEIEGGNLNTKNEVERGSKEPDRERGNSENVFEVEVENDAEVEDLKPEFVKHKTFDEICVNVVCLTDDELQAARENVRESIYRYKKRKQIRMMQVSKIQMISLQM